MHIIGLLVLAFMVGRAVQKWADGSLERDAQMYEAGFAEGARMAGGKG